MEQQVSWFVLLFFLQSSQIAETTPKTKHKRAENEAIIEDLLEEMFSCSQPGTDFSIYVHMAEVNL